MEDKINYIDMNGKLNQEELYSLFKTNSSKRNEEISEKIDNFKCNMNFFEYYSNKDIKNLFNIFKLKVPENNDESFSSFKSDIEQYIFCISQIILSVKLLSKTYDILTKTVINVKNNLSKLKSKNKLENYNQEDLFLYLDSLLKISEKNSKFNDSSFSTLLNSNNSSCLVTPKKSLFSKYSSEYKIDCFSNDETESSIYDIPSTPKFQSNPSKNIENQEKNNPNLQNLNGNMSPIKKDSVLTLSKYIFVEEPFTPKNVESKLIKSPTAKPKIKKNSTERKIPQTENSNKYKNKINASYETGFINKNNNKNHYKNLLEMINKMYKTGLINSEEKVELKKLVIEKSNKIEYLYYNIFTNSKNDKNALITEVKKIVN